jgi:hypothetical protein
MVQKDFLFLFSKLILVGFEHTENMLNIFFGSLVIVTFSRQDLVVVMLKELRSVSDFLLKVQNKLK